MRVFDVAVAAAVADAVVRIQGERGGPEATPQWGIAAWEATAAADAITVVAVADAAVAATQNSTPGRPSRCQALLAANRSLGFGVAAAAGAIAAAERAATAAAAPDAPDEAATGRDGPQRLNRVSPCCSNTPLGRRDGLLVKIKAEGAAAAAAAPAAHKRGYVAAVNSSMGTAGGLNQNFCCC